MAYRTKILTLAVWCDKPSCQRSMKVPNPEWAPYSDQFRAWFRTTGWSLWVSRGQRHYCPDHGPSSGSKMRKVG